MDMVNKNCGRRPQLLKTRRLDETDCSECLYHTIWMHCCVHFFQLPEILADASLNITTVIGPLCPLSVDEVTC